MQNEKFRMAFAWQHLACQLNIMSSRSGQPESDLKLVETVGFRFWNSRGEKKQC